jgi:FlaA1/EpsC-like NDP-sugar epimerase
MSLMTAPSRSITALYVILLFNLVVASRLSFRGLRKAVALLAARTDRVLIVGAGEMAEAAARYIVSSRSRNLRLVGFADDDNFKLGKFVHGYKVLGTIEELAKIHAGTEFNQILFAASTGSAAFLDPAQRNGNFGGASVGRQSPARTEESGERGRRLTNYRQVVFSMEHSSAKRDDWNYS